MSDKACDDSSGGLEWDKVKTIEMLLRDLKNSPASDYVLVLTGRKTTLREHIHRNILPLLERPESKGGE